MDIHLSSVLWPSRCSLPVDFFKLSFLHYLVNGVMAMLGQPSSQSEIRFGKRRYIRTEQWPAFKGVLSVVIESP